MSSATTDAGESIVARNWYIQEKDRPARFPGPLLDSYNFYIKGEAHKVKIYEQLFAVCAWI
jgi:hypothetical protein